MSSPRTHPTRDRGAIEGIVEELAERFQWEDWSGFDLSEVWDSRTAVLYKIEPRNGAPTRVLKVGTRWKQEKAREVYEDLFHMGELFDSSDSVKLQVPIAFGWHDSPPCVCVEFVPGVDLSEVLTELSGEAEMSRLVEECGSALGLFHASYSFDPDATDAPLSRHRLDRTVATMARRVGVDARRVAGLDWSRRASRRYGDFAPYNLRMDQTGRIWVLDQPSGRSYAPIHRDIAYFLDRVDRFLWRAPSRELGDRWVWRARLERSLLDAYARTGPAALDSSEDKALLSLYLTHKQIHTARKRLKQGRVREIPRFLRMAAEWRRQAAKGVFADA